MTDDELSTGLADRAQEIREWLDANGCEHFTLEVYARDKERDWGNMILSLGETRH